MERHNQTTESTSRNLITRIAGRLGLRRILGRPAKTRELTKDEMELEKALDELGFEPAGFFHEVGVRPAYSRGGGVTIVAARGAPPTPEVVAAIKSMSQPRQTGYHGELEQNPPNNDGEKA